MDVRPLEPRAPDLLSEDVFVSQSVLDRALEVGDVVALRHFHHVRDGRVPAALVEADLRNPNEEPVRNVSSPND